MLTSCQDISLVTWDGANNILYYFLNLSLRFYIIFQEGLSASFTVESLISLSKDYQGTCILFRPLWLSGFPLSQLAD